jgi:O-antigen/teichoic acid export membrane protein
MLSHLLPDPSYASLYDVAYSGIQLAQLGATAGFAGVTFAAFARMAVRSPESMPSFYHLLVRAVTLLTVPLFAFLLLNADAFVVALYGGAFAGSIRLIQGMAMFRLGSRLFGGGENAEYILSLGGVKKFVAVGALSAGCNVALNFALVPVLAAAGSVIASGTANLMANGLGFMLVRERVHIQGTYWLKVVALAMACSWAVAWIDTPRPFLTLAARFAVFIILMCAAGAAVRIISGDDRMRIQAALRGLTQGETPPEGGSA